MTTIVEIPNLGEVEFPDSMSKKQIESQAQKLFEQHQQAQGEQIRQVAAESATQDTFSAGETLGRQALESFIGNILEVPNLVNQGIKQLSPLQQARNLAGLVTGQEPAQPERLDVPSTSDVFGAAQVAGEGAANLRQRLAGQENLPPVAGLQEASQNQQQITQQQQQQRPVLSTVGQVGGDIATLQGMGPLRGMFRKGEEAFSRVGKSKLKPSIRKDIDDFVRESSKTLGPVATRASEAGLEGATLAILNEGDPVKTAMLTGGGQAFGTGMIGLNKLLLSGNLSSKFIKTGGSFLGLTALIQMTKEKVPGGRDRILESLESSAGTLATIGALGFLSGIAGLGRSGERFSANTRQIADTIRSIPRGALVSAAKDVFEQREKGDNTLELVATKLAENPEFFGRENANRLARAFEKGRLKEEIEKLRKNNQTFKKRFKELQ